MAMATTEHDEYQVRSDRTIFHMYETINDEYV